MTNIIVNLTNLTTGEITSGVVHVHVDLHDNFTVGLVFLFAVGITAMGVRWVRQILGGHHEEL